MSFLSIYQAHLLCQPIVDQVKCWLKIPGHILGPRIGKQQLKLHFMMAVLWLEPVKKEKRQKKKREEETKIPTFRETIVSPVLE